MEGIQDDGIDDQCFLRPRLLVARFTTISFIGFQNGVIFLAIRLFLLVKSGGCLDREVVAVPGLYSRWERYFWDIHQRYCS